jgi:hypothetical protein
MGRILVILAAVVIFGGGFAASAYASYRGFGLVSSGHSARAGSINGIYILGGGPGTGK